MVIRVGGRARTRAWIWTFALIIPVFGAPALSQTPFTYQGQLKQNGQPANGSFTISFSLYDAATGGNQIGVTLVANVTVTDGIFTRELDFGGGAFDGAAGRWLEIQVDANPPMAPRVKVTPAPEAHTARAFRVPFMQTANVASPNCVLSITNQGTGYAICGEAQAGTNAGVRGSTTSVANGAAGVFGLASGATGNTAGVWGRVNSSTANASGVYGESRGGGVTFGVYGYTNSTTNNARGVYGLADAASGATYGVWGKSNSTSTNAAGVYGETISGNTAGVWGQTTSAVSGAAGIYGKSFSGPTNGVYGVTESADNNAAAVFGHNRATTGSGVGVWGRANSPDGYGGYFSNAAGGYALWANGKTSTHCLELTGGCDLAEPFRVERDENGPAIEPGMVVVIDPSEPGRLRLSTSPYDPRVAGIISGANNVQPGVVMQGDPGSNALGDWPVALTGRVYAWCDAGHGEIEPGDRLTSSPTPGHAMKASDPMRAPGSVIGKAMSGLRQGRGFVLVLVQPQ